MSKSAGLIKETKDTLQKVYLEWANDYLTMTQMAEDYGLEYMEISSLVMMGRRIHKERTEGNGGEN